MQYRLEMFATEEDLENASLYEPSSFVGVVFMDPSAMSYRLRFPYDQLPQPSDYTESFGNFWIELNSRHVNWMITYLGSFFCLFCFSHLFVQLCELQSS